MASAGTDPIVRVDPWRLFPDPDGPFVAEVRGPGWVLHVRGHSRDLALEKALRLAAELGEAR